VKKVGDFGAASANIIERELEAMGAVMGKVKGKADGGKVKAMVQKLLSE